MRKNLSENMMTSLYSGDKQKKGNCFECSKGSINDRDNKRLLVIINVLGSAGPLRFLVNEEDVVDGVIATALKLYAKEGRLPILGSDSTKFLLYCSHAGSDALGTWDEIGSCGGRNFVLCKKPEQPSNMSEARSQMISQKRGRGWRTWLNKSMSIKI
ncbi:uncharacterized protein At4g22758-like isoform X1 [Chenopodium quinoa]|uniref:uncharacterized protein At4g22758-like isoform X1 n=1 Tax=Chenopodium quinoa TaxID=63459 RepID=UPI000B77C8F8|nr:uncharacterized protein At4g22758-like isoform X1 [Chenopodium quinoa]